jgi:hypothetical protein
MSEPNEVPADLRDLFDDYVSGLLDEDRVKLLEARLLADAQARAWFVRYCRLDTDIHLEVRARLAGERALRTIDEQVLAAGADGGSRRAERTVASRLRGLRSARYAAMAAAAVLAGVGVWLWLSGKSDAGDEIAWLINAQNCQWADQLAPAGDMRAGKVLRLERGLAEIRFLKGARVVLEAPASLELLSGNSGRLARGKLTAKVPESAKGFQLHLPQGKVIDLGTEFGAAVTADGSSDVYVFAGTVEAHADPSKDAPSTSISLTEKQAACIDAHGVSLKAPWTETGRKDFVRAIPVVVPRIFSVDFTRAVEGTLQDALGRGTGLTHRLPGTGQRLRNNDGNLSLNLEEGRLELTTTNSDINTQFCLDTGEYLGIRLADLGFGGLEDFEVTVVVPNVPALKAVGQFGLYAGARSDHNVRGGLISRKEPEQYRQFLVQNQGGNDNPPHYVGVTYPGQDLRLTLKREQARFSLTVENLTTGTSTILSMPQPRVMEGDPDLHVGFFGANTQSELRRTLILKEFKVTVWTIASGSS